MNFREYTAAISSPTNVLIVKCLSKIHHSQLLLSAFLNFSTVFDHFTEEIPAFLHLEYFLVHEWMMVNTHMGSRRITKFHESLPCEDILRACRAFKCYAILVFSPARVRWVHTPWSSTARILPFCYQRTNGGHASIHGDVTNGRAGRALVQAGLTQISFARNGDRFHPVVA